MSFIIGRIVFTVDIELLLNFFMLISSTLVSRPAMVLFILLIEFYKHFSW